MSEAFNVPIRVDPGSSNSEVDKFEKTLAKAEKRVENLSKNFDRLGEVMERRARSTQIHTQLTNTLANSMSGLASAVEREHRMLDAIRGPMQRFQQDTQTLDSMLKRGVITLNEYTTHLGKLRSQAGIANPASAVSLPTPAAAPRAGGLGGLGGVAAMAGAAFGAREVIELGDSYTNLENRLRTVATAQYGVNELMARTKEIAQTTRSDWGTTAEAFTRMRKATEGLGIGTERALKMTETLSMALQTSGASSSEAAAGTLQLMQAMRSGTLQGDEFRSVSENMPDILDALAKSMGVTTGQLKKMGSEGKITTAQLVNELESSEVAIREKFMGSTATASQQWTMFKNELVDSIGTFLKQTQLIPKLGKALMDFGSALKPIASLLGDLVSIGGTFGGWLDSAEKALGKFGTAARIAMGPIGMIGKVGGYAKEAIGFLTDGVDLFTMRQQYMAEQWKKTTPEGQKFNAMMQLQLEIIRAIGMQAPVTANAIAKLNDPWADKRNPIAKAWDQVTSSIGHAGKIIDDFAEKQKKAAGSMKTYATEVNGLHSKNAYETQMRSQTDFSAVDGDWAKSITEANISAITMQRYLEHLSLQAKKYELDMASANDGVARGFNKIGDEIRDTASLTENLLVNSFHNFENAIVDAARTGELSFSGMVDAFIADLARLAVRQLAAAAMTAAIGGGAGGGGMGPLGGTILDPMSWGSAGLSMKVPHFAAGGAARVMGHGGTDSTFVPLMATPGERIIVQTPGQQAAAREASRPASSPAPQPVIVQLDQRAILRAMQSPFGAQVIDDILRKNPGLLNR